MNSGVDTYSLQFHHLNSAVTLEAVNIDFLTVILVDSIDELGITDYNGPSAFDKTMLIFVGFFALTRLKYFNSAILKLPKNISKLSFRKWLVIFKIFVNKLIRKLLLYVRYLLYYQRFKLCTCACALFLLPICICSNGIKICSMHNVLRMYYDCEYA